MGHPYRTSCPPPPTCDCSNGPIDIVCTAVAVAIVSLACLLGTNHAPPPPAAPPLTTQVKTMVLVYECADSGSPDSLDCRLASSSPWPKSLATTIEPLACR